jgi:hypothetical protein
LKLSQFNIFIYKFSAFKNPVFPQNQVLFRNGRNRNQKAGIPNSDIPPTPLKKGGFA